MLAARLLALFLASPAVAQTDAAGPLTTGSSATLVSSVLPSNASEANVGGSSLGPASPTGLESLASLSTPAANASSPSATSSSQPQPSSQAPSSTYSYPQPPIPANTATSPPNPFALTSVDEPPRTRRYNFRLSTAAGAPDGFLRQLSVVNNQFPGPLIEANIGDTLEITVQNDLDIPQSVHWHG